MPSKDEQNSPAPWAKGAAEAAFAAHDEIWKPVIKAVKRIAPNAGRAVKRITGAPGKIYSAIDIWTAPDPLREIVGVGGGLVGSAAGTAMGTAAGGINAPIGAVAGGAIGSDFAQGVYDEHANDPAVVDARRRLIATRDWINDRTADRLGRHPRR